MHSTSRASASGTTTSTSESSDSGNSGGGSGNGSSNQQAQSALNSAGRLAGGAGTNNVSSNSVGSASAKRRDASTTSGSVQAAAAFTLNIQSAQSNAVIDDGITVIATGEDQDGAITVESLTRTDSEITANGSASQGKIGVGVAVAINVVSYESNAYIGDAAIQANHLKVHAGLILDEAEESGEENQVDAEDNGWFKALVKSAVNTIIMEIADAIGLADLVADANSVLSLIHI